jgi:hypothetical protein
MLPFDTSDAVCYDDAERTERNPGLCTDDVNTQAAGVAVYRIGCFFEAILILFYGETLALPRCRMSKPCGIHGS